jgi:hypothetical protein
MVGEHSTASCKTQTFIFHTEAGPEVEVKRAIMRVERVLRNVGRVKGEEPVEDSLPEPL